MPKNSKNDFQIDAEKAAKVNASVVFLGQHIISDTEFGFNFLNPRQIAFFCFIFKEKYKRICKFQNFFVTLQAELSASE